MFDLSISIGKDERANGLFFHRNGKIKSSHTKRETMRDISKECGENKLYNRNYIGVEYLVLSMCNFEFELFTLDIKTY